MTKRYFLVEQYHLYSQSVLVEVDDNELTDEMVGATAVDLANKGNGTNVLDPEYIEVAEDYGRSCDDLNDEVRDAVSVLDLTDRQGGFIPGIKLWAEVTPDLASELLQDVEGNDGSS